MINRLLEPDRGEVSIDGQPTRSQPPHLLRRRIGYVFQRIGLFPHLTVAENIGITPRLLGWPRERIAARVEELLDAGELAAEFAARYPAALSGGQRQRVGVARALAARPAIMLMDEPFGALDPVTRDALGTEYRRLHEQMGLTTLMVTHDVLEACCSPIASSSCAPARSSPTARRASCMNERDDPRRPRADGHAAPAGGARRGAARRSACARG